MTDTERGIELEIPAECKRGHELTPRTTNVSVDHGRPFRWECLRCLRSDCWRAHYGEHPAERILDESEFLRQQGATTEGGKPKVWTTRVRFGSGWQFADTDPTPELRAERQRLADEQAAAERAEAERLQHEQDRAERRRKAETATQRIRALMTGSAA